MKGIVIVTNSTMLTAKYSKRLAWFSAALPMTENSWKSWKSPDTRSIWPVSFTLNSKANQTYLIHYSAASLPQLWLAIRLKPCRSKPFSKLKLLKYAYGKLAPRHPCLQFPKTI